jgi:hypothetical protein
MVATCVLCAVLVVAAGRVAADGDTVLQSFYSAPAQDNLVGASDATLAYANAQKYVSCDVLVCKCALVVQSLVLVLSACMVRCCMCARPQ